MAINSVNQVTRMGMAGGMWQPHGSYAGKEEGEVPVSKPTTSGGSSGRFFTWTPDEIQRPDQVRRYRKTDEDFELERLLKEAIKKEDQKRQAQRVAKELELNVNAVADLHRATRAVERETLKLQQTSKLSQQETQRRLNNLKEEEDIIMSILLSEF